MWGLSALFDDHDDEPKDDDERIDIEPGQVTADAPGAFDLTDGDDTFYGTTGSDTIDAGQGDDFVGVNGEPDPQFTNLQTATDDVVYHSAGDDIFTNGDDISYGADLVRGGAGDDTIDLFGSDGATAYGDLGDDTINVVDLRSGNDSDVAYRGDGNDVISADGRDVISGGSGDDVFEIWAEDCNEPGPVIITDYEDGDTIEVWVDYDPEPGIRTITPELTDDGQSMFIPTPYTNFLGQGIILEGVTDIESIDILIVSQLDYQPQFPCD